MTDYSNENLSKAQELKREVELWVDRTFNFIQVEVYERMAGDCLFEYIEQPELDYEEFLNDYNLWSEFWIYYFEHCEIPEKDRQEEREYAEQKATEAGQSIFEYLTTDADGNDLGEESEIYWFCEHEHERDFESFREQHESDNYPMWNTLFELRRGDWPDLTEAAKKLNLGVISGLEPFNDTIFMMSCGHSFYGSYWIPLYLEVFPEEKKKWQGVSYSMM